MVGAVLGDLRESVKEVSSLRNFRDEARLLLLTSDRVLRGPSGAAGCLIEKQREGVKTSSVEIEPRRDETLTKGSEKM